ncbi:MAG: LysR family transcriptional regulator [Pseudomonadota bacterium]
MDRLNYHHLRYFREVAHEGNLTRVAEKLNVSQSALSTQIKQLEERMGHALFVREGRTLKLTEAGRIALDHADRIFQGGQELLAALGDGAGPTRPLKIGAMSTLSRNFQIKFLAPVLRQDTALTLVSGNARTLWNDLRALALDVVLATEAPPSAAEGLIAHRIAEQAVALYGVPGRLGHPSLRALLENEPIILPTESSVRAGFDSLAARLDVTPEVAAEVDDMAMVRLLAREGVGLAVVPEIVVADEVRSGLLQAAPFTLGIAEPFYAVTVKRQFPHPLLQALLTSSPHLPPSTA